MAEAGRVAKLEAMGIDVWRLRGRSAAPDRGAGGRATAPRVRLEAGGGAWLLVVDDASRARFETLINDVCALLGNDRCRFGTWSDSAQSGVAAEEWDAHGIVAAVVFGPAKALPAGFVSAGPLQELAESPAARRSLWQRLRPLLEA